MSRRYLFIRTYVCDSEKVSVCKDQVNVQKLATYNNTEMPTRSIYGFHSLSTSNAEYKLSLTIRRVIKSKKKLQPAALSLRSTVRWELCRGVPPNAGYITQHSHRKFYDFRITCNRMIFSLFCNDACSLRLGPSRVKVCPILLTSGRQNPERLSSHTQRFCFHCVRIKPYDGILPIIGSNLS